MIPGNRGKDGQNHWGQNRGQSDGSPPPLDADLLPRPGSLGAHGFQGLEGHAPRRGLSPGPQHRRPILPFREKGDGIGVRRAPGADGWTPDARRPTLRDRGERGAAVRNRHGREPSRAASRRLGVRRRVAALFRRVATRREAKTASRGRTPKGALRAPGRPGPSSLRPGPLLSEAEVRDKGRERPPHRRPYSSTLLVDRRDQVLKPAKRHAGQHFSTSAFQRFPGQSPRLPSFSFSVRSRVWGWIGFWKTPSRPRST